MDLNKDVIYMTYKIGSIFTHIMKLWFVLYFMINIYFFFQVLLF